MLKLNHKQINDNIHGPIKISNYACYIIDTMYFERLRYLKQLGTCHYVFSSATHTRYEHSLGTYHLANWILNSIKNNSQVCQINNCMDNISELKSYYQRTYNNCEIYDRLDPYVCELVKIAGLCHDLGHGPYSHFFDDVFIPKMQEKYNKEPHYLDKHENRSCEIIKLIIKNNDILKNVIDDDEIKFIQKLINPTKECIGFIYQIISNNFNSIDIDKFDYLIRDTKNLEIKSGFNHIRLLNDAMVIDNIICYPKQMYSEVEAIFNTRYRLHKQVYTHKVVLMIKNMFNDILILLDPILNIYDSIYDMDKFVLLTDNYVIESMKFIKNNIDKFNNSIDSIENRVNKAYSIWQNINSRNLYKLIGSIISKNKLSFTLNDLKIIEPSISEYIDNNKVIIHFNRIGFVSGNKKNPFDDLYFYDNKNPEKLIKIDKDFSLLISDTYQEYIYTLFVDNKNDLELVEKINNVFMKLKNFMK